MKWDVVLGRWFARLAMGRQIVWAGRVPFFFGTALLVLFLTVPQCRDAFRAFLQDMAYAGWRHAVWRVGVLLVVTLTGAMALWFWGRQNLRLQPGAGRNERGWLRDHLPRICAVAPLLAMGIMLAVVPAQDVEPRLRLALGAVFLLSGVGLYVLFYQRRQWRVLAWSDTDRAYQWMGYVGGILALAVFLFSLFQRQHAYLFSPMGILWLGAAFWTTLLSPLVIHGARYGIPWLALLALLACIFGATNLSDNHRIRHTQASEELLRETDPVTRTSVVDAFRAWKKAHPDGPIIFVAAEGGGIYAAYHAGYLLARLQEATKSEFGRQVFMISGVSGGSVGSGLFVSLLAAQQRSAPGAVDFVGATRTVLDNDLLSPLLLAACGPDALQFLLPWPVSAFDRARALEDTLAYRWELAERKWIQPDRSGQRIDWGPAGSIWDLWTRGEGKTATLQTGLPALFLNTTVVETGGRAVISPYGVPNKGASATAPKIYHLWAGARDLRIPLPTALVLSARFPYVTPPGGIERIRLRSLDERMPYQCSGEDWRFADGGYFENSGADTLLDVLTLLRGEKEADGVTPLLDMQRVEVLVIESDNGEPPACGEGLADLLSPVRTMLRARQDRAVLARERLRASLDSNAYSHSVLLTRPPVEPECSPLESRPPVAPDIPLGWMLSRRAQEQIRGQVDQKLNAIAIQVMQQGPSAWAKLAPRSPATILAR